MKKIYYNDCLVDDIKHRVEYQNCYEYDTLDEGVLNVFKNFYVVNTDPTSIDGKLVKGNTNSLTDNQKSLKMVRYLALDIDGSSTDGSKTSDNTSPEEVFKFLNEQGFGYIYYTGTSHKKSKVFSYHIILDIDITESYTYWINNKVKNIIQNWFKSHNIYFDFSVNSVNRNLKPNPKSDHSGVVAGKIFPLESIIREYFENAVIISTPPLITPKKKSSLITIKTSVNRFINDSNKEELKPIIKSICDTIHTLQKKEKKGDWYSKMSGADYFKLINAIKGTLGEDGKELLINASTTWVDNNGKKEPIEIINKNWNLQSGDNGTIEQIMSVYTNMIYKSGAGKLSWTIKSYNDRFSRALGIEVEVEETYKAIYNEKTLTTYFYNQDNERVFMKKVVNEKSDELDINANMLHKTVKRAMLDKAELFEAPNLDLIVLGTIRQVDEYIEINGKIPTTMIRDMFKENLGDTIVKQNFKKLFSKIIEEKYSKIKISKEYYIKKGTTYVKSKKDSISVSNMVFSHNLHNTITFSVGNHTHSCTNNSNSSTPPNNSSKSKMNEIYMDDDILCVMADENHNPIIIVEKEIIMMNYDRKVEKRDIYGHVTRYTVPDIKECGYQAVGHIFGRHWKSGDFDKMMDYNEKLTIILKTYNLLPNGRPINDRNPLIEKDITNTEELITCWTKDVKDDQVAIYA